MSLDPLQPPTGESPLLSAFARQYQLRLAPGDPHALGDLATAFARLPFETPYPLRLLVTIAIEVVLMTWWLMPLVTRRLARWIYPQRRTT